MQHDAEDSECPVCTIEMANFNQSPTSRLSFGPRSASSFGQRYTPAMSTSITRQEISPQGEVTTSRSVTHEECNQCLERPRSHVRFDDAFTPSTNNFRDNGATCSTKTIRTDRSNIARSNMDNRGSQVKTTTSTVTTEHDPGRNYHDTFDSTWDLSNDIIKGMIRRAPSTSVRYASTDDSNVFHDTIPGTTEQHTTCITNIPSATGTTSVTSHTTEYHAPDVSNKRSKTLYDDQGRVYLLVADEEQVDETDEDSWIGSIKKSIRSSSQSLVKRLNNFGGTKTEESRTTVINQPVPSPVNTVSSRTFRTNNGYQNHGASDVRLDGQSTLFGGATTSSVHANPHVPNYTPSVLSRTAFPKSSHQFDTGFPSVHGQNGGGFPSAHGQGNGGGFPSAHGQINGGGFPSAHGQINGGGFPSAHGQINGGGFPSAHGQINGGGFPSAHGHINRGEHLSAHGIAADAFPGRSDMFDQVAGYNQQVSNSYNQPIEATHIYPNYDGHVNTVESRTTTINRPSYTSHPTTTVIERLQNPHGGCVESVDSRTIQYNQPTSSKIVQSTYRNGQHGGGVRTVESRTTQYNPPPPNKTVISTYKLPNGGVRTIESHTTVQRDDDEFDRAWSNSRSPNNNTMVETTTTYPPDYTTSVKNFAIPVSSTTALVGATPSRGVTIAGSQTPTCSWQTTVDRDMDRYYISEQVLVDEPDFKRCHINKKYVTPEGTRECSTAYERKADTPATPALQPQPQPHYPQQHNWQPYQQTSQIHNQQPYQQTSEIHNQQPYQTHNQQPYNAAT